MTKLISELTDDEIRAEISRRNEAKRQEKELRQINRAKRINEVLTREVVDALVPEHGRTSCNDETLGNSGYWGSSTPPRCSRCELLRAVLEGWNEGYVLSIDIWLDKE